MFDVKDMPGNNGGVTIAKKKWGKIGAPGSAKRKAHMRKIRKKR